MPTSVVFPKANLERTSGEIASWSVAEGDEVTKGDVLFLVEDDKAAIEVDSPADGFIGGLFAIDEEIDVGAVVATIFDTKEELAAAASSSAQPQAPAEPVSAQPLADVAAVAAVSQASQPEASGIAGAVKSTPLARRIARDNGLSLEGLQGTGPNGRVQKRDVLALLHSGTATTTASPSLAPVAPTAQAAPVAAVLAAAGSHSASRLNTVWYQKGEGLTVAFLHGFGADCTSWGGLLSGARYDWPAIALDLPCHGGSSTELPADLDAIAASVESTLQAEGVTDLMIAAHSFGSAVAARIASRGILRIRALCLFAPAGLSPQINPDFVAGMLRARSAESLRPWLLELVDDPGLISDLFCQRTAAARASDEAFAAFQRFGQQFFPDGVQRFDVLRDLESYLGPLRVIYGRQDRILPVEATRNLPGNAALHLLDRCGHMPHLEHRRETLRIVEEVRRSV